MEERPDRSARTPPMAPAPEILLDYRLAWEFRHECRTREAHRQYCDWYRQAARQHRQELARMRGDPDLLGWMLRWRRR